MERNVNELENKNDIDDTASDGDGEEREVWFFTFLLIFSYRSMRQFIIPNSYDTSTATYSSAK
mgnify:FL=1